MVRVLGRSLGNDGRFPLSVDKLGKLGIRLSLCVPDAGSGYVAGAQLSEEAGLLALQHGGEFPELR